MYVSATLIIDLMMTLTFPDTKLTLTLAV